jgi:hypothetical protein
MKFGFQMVNTSPVLNQMGQVYVLPARQRLFVTASPQSGMSLGGWQTFVATIIAHPETKTYSGANFSRTKEFFSHPVDDTAYTSYENWEGTTDVNGFWRHAAVWPGDVSLPRPMNFFWVYFEGVSTSQTYTISCNAAYYTRWPLGTIMAQSAKNVPVASHNAVVSQRLNAETSGTIARDAMEVGLGALSASTISRYGSPAMGFLSGAARNAAAFMRGTGALAGEIAEFGVPLAEAALPLLPII